ncbi:ArdC family protein [Larkinella sp. C7]|uniref:ArdC family protein n=1 Tax=Larkinella sp. C7 TaxID=2576607 RepID=UPI001111387D|nr:zincin-like metallopeptidase domain-containing protein [Larkinella sp. C7]
MQPKKLTFAHDIDVFQKVTNLFIEKLENGVNPWVKSWSMVGLLPQNYFNKNTYQGINLFLLSLSPYDVPFFCTFNQARENGGTIKKGAKSLPVIYWNFVDSKTETITGPDGTEQPKKKAFIKYYNVFNICDVEGIDFVLPALPTNPNEPIQICETIVAQMPQAPAIRHTNKARAYYSPLADLVNMPDQEQFSSSKTYYSVLFHELTHSTGHASRLNREGVTQLCPFGSTNYSREELVAELGAAFLNTFTGIADETLLDNSAAYLKGWLKPLRDDKKFIFWAAKEAQKAVQFIAPVLSDPHPEPLE